MIIVYDSVTGVGKAFAEKLGYETVSVKDFKGGKAILVTRTSYFGKPPKSTVSVLKKYPCDIIGVVSNGNRTRFKDKFCISADILEKEHQANIIARIDGSGTQEDVDAVIDFIKGL